MKFEITEGILKGKVGFLITMEKDICILSLNTESGVVQARINEDKVKAVL